MILWNHGWGYQGVKKKLVRRSVCQANTWMKQSKYTFPGKASQVNPSRALKVQKFKSHMTPELHELQSHSFVWWSANDILSPSICLFRSTMMRCNLYKEWEYRWSLCLSLTTGCFRLETVCFSLCVYVSLKSVIKKVRLTHSLLSLVAVQEKSGKSISRSWKTTTTTSQCTGHLFIDSHTYTHTLGVGNKSSSSGSNSKLVQTSVRSPMSHPLENLQLTKARVDIHQKWLRLVQAPAKAQ